MNLGYAVAILGLLGVVAGGGMYAVDWHRTIGLAGIVLGVILLIAGVWLLRSPPPKPAPAPAPQSTP